MATILCSQARDSTSNLQLLQQVLATVPSDRWLLIEDNLSIHQSRDVKTALLAWPEIQLQFIPKYVCWLNLIEPWWKQLKALSLKGRRFETTAELTEALYCALAYWNTHRHPYYWRKMPKVWPTEFLGGIGSTVHR